MSLPVIPNETPDGTALDRSRELRRRSEEALRRSADLRERGAQLRSPPNPRPLKAELLLGAARETLAQRQQASRDDNEAREAAEEDAWYRERIREMLADGWTRAELADVGVTDELLRELGLDPPD